MKTTFIYAWPHKMHKAWADSITSNHSPFVFKKILNWAHTCNPIIHQLISIIYAPFIPSSDIFLLEGIMCALPAIIRKKKNTKIITLNADNFFDIYSKSKGIKRKIYDWYLKHIDGAISNSEFVDIKLKENTQIKSTIVNPGIEKKWFNVKRNKYSNNICHGLSMIRKQKGSDLVIEAFERMNKNSNLYLLGPVGKDINIPNDKRIIVTGWTAKPEKYLNKCSIFVNPARYEPFGMNIIEAMAAGFAPIISENCGAKEIVAKASPKLIIKPNIKEIIKTINWLEKENRKEILGKKAKEIAKEYTTEKSVKNFKNSFNKLIREIK